MRVGIIIPDRGDRPELLKNCLRMLGKQTLLPEIVEVMDMPARSEAVDLGWRYKTGYDNLRGKGLDMICLIENDDWYHPSYLERMAIEWQKHPNVKLLGHNYTIYYSVRISKWFEFGHFDRASAMNTAIKPDLEGIDWGEEHDPYTDINLWYKLGESSPFLNGSNGITKITFKPEMPICLGIKGASEGLVGGMFHHADFGRYDQDDASLEFLRSVVEPSDPEGFKFYKKLIEKYK